jgi:uncharacterized protein (TIGR00255 family)
MIKSMTGYGKTEFTVNNKKITIEIKSLNSKNLDLMVRIANPFKEKELEIRKMLSNKLVRGKVIFNLFVENTGTESTNVINSVVVSAYINQLSNLGNISKEKALEIAMSLPNVLDAVEDELDTEEWQVVKSNIETTLTKIDDFRKDEGEVLKNDFILRIDTIQNINNEISTQAKDRLVLIKEKFNKALAELKQEKDENRFEQELIFYLEKLDITEERIRLNNHLDYFKKELAINESNGKKLGFICQEIGREINTTGSKANYAPMQQNVVLMKDELEKIKEQLLNVL